MIWLILVLVLVGSNLALRRLPRGHLMRLILLWITIFAIAFLLVRLLTGIS
ncbi:MULTISPECIES: hypothetical protein [Sphingobium]|uniref:Uncharacterized protein n=1 Tax=Sphingobium lignivorans TaxID=2735886 RepID=A0ABR6NF36_9SPHN|nr:MULTISPECIES: hypothetical protein [Sphingobium]MBB5985895.1 hypothetical protein [Sphingobium lignivorans]BAK66693.1 hypothetical protein SLG_20180 [Sphingobium sp. SYK-6]